MSRPIAAMLSVQSYARQRRISQLAKQLVVIHADNGNFLRYIDGCLSTGFEHSMSAIVVASHDGDWLRQVLDPGC